MQLDAGRDTPALSAAITPHGVGDLMTMVSRHHLMMVGVHEGSDWGFDQLWYQD